MKKFITVIKASILGMGITIFVMNLALSSASTYQAAPQSSDRAKQMMAKMPQKKPLKIMRSGLRKWAKMVRTSLLSIETKTLLKSSKMWLFMLLLMN